MYARLTPTTANLAFTLACASFAVWLVCPAMYVAAAFWSFWLVVWPLLILVGTPLLAVMALTRPRATVIVLLALAACWAWGSHPLVYWNVLDYWVRKPGVPGSKGWEADSIKAVFRFGGAALLVLTALLTALGGGDGPDGLVSARLKGTRISALTPSPRSPSAAPLRTPTA